MKTKTATKSKLDLGSAFKDMGTIKNDQANAIEPYQKTDAPLTTKMKPRVASLATTRAKMSNVAVSGEMANKLASIDMSAPDDVPGVGFEDDIPTTTSNLPAVMSQHLVAAGVTDPEWHMVKNLPGYMASGIRSIGRAVFAPFTKTPIEEIQVLANVGGSGPNETKELSAVASFLQKSGKRDMEAELEFNERIPEYNAQIKIYRALGYTFMLVKDFAGQYIYSWPTSDEEQPLSLESIRNTTFSMFIIKESK